MPFFMLSFISRYMGPKILILDSLEVIYMNLIGLYFILATLTELHVGLFFIDRSTYHLLTALCCRNSPFVKTSVRLRMLALP
uniref:Uncharacterized protein n=1 Tax=Rhizophora mucronata TaxID=61149 RepID=A0A2P2N0P5_RHIMU